MNSTFNGVYVKAVYKVSTCNKKASFPVKKALSVGAARFELATPATPLQCAAVGQHQRGSIMVVIFVIIQRKLLWLHSTKKEESGI